MYYTITQNEIGKLAQARAAQVNVEHGRLRGWLHSPKEAAEEMQDPAASQYFNGNQQIGSGNAFLMLGNGKGEA